MVVKRFRPHKMLLLWLVVIATALTGMAGPACASLQSATWTTQEDFERATRVNVDTSSTPGDAKIGLTKDLVSEGKISCTTSDKIYTIGSDRPSVAVIDVTSKTLLKTIELPGKPSGIVFNSTNNKIYIGNYNDNKVSVIDCNTDTIIKTITAGSGAYPAAYNPNGKKLYIANAAEQTITVVDAVSDTVTVAALPVVSGPYATGFDTAKDKLYVTNKFNHSVSIIDGPTDQVESTVSIEPVVATIGGQAPGNLGLRVDARALGIPPHDRLHLRWSQEPLKSSQKLQFQIRSASDLASLDSLPYLGPDGTADSWYDSTTSGVELANGSEGEEVSIPLDLPYAPCTEVQVRMASDETASPVLHSVSLDYENYPDLVATAVSGPASAFIGRQVTVSSTVANQGTEPAGSFKVGIFLTDLTGARNLLCDRTVASLAAGASDTASSTCTVPNLVEGSYYLEAVADYTGQVTEGIETNNGKLGATIQIAKPFVDLVVTGVSGPAIATIGGNVALSATVANQGNEAAGSFKVGFYLTDSKGKKNFLCDSSVSALLEGASAATSASCTVPTLPTGDYLVEASADYLNAVTESNETNNSGTGNAIRVHSPQTDLVVKSVSGTVANGKLTYSVTVQNYGNTAAGGFYTAIYLSPDASITSADRFVVSHYNSAGLAGGASITLSNTVDLPANLPAGNYYVGAIADYAPTSIPESDETNNALAGNQLYLNIDLVVTSVTGTVANGKITYSTTVKNNGNAPAGGFYTAIYLSSDATITSADRFVVSHYNSAGLAGGASITLSNTVDLPANVPAGNYYVGAIADYAPVSVPESDESNNALAGNQQYLNIDLVVTSVTGTVANGKLSYTATLKNNGNAPAGGFYTAIYLSTDSTITSADRFVVSHYNSAGLNAGASVTLSNTVDLPANVPAGTYYVGAIADYAPVSVPESDESNNALAGNQQYLNIDLVVTSVTGTVANGKLTYSATVQNNGNAPAGGFYTAIYLSTDATITSADRFVVSHYNSAGLTAGASTTLTNTVDLPTNVPAGTYYVGAIVDTAPASVPESDESNNALAGNQQYLNIDLVVTSVTSTVANGKISYSATVKNIGTAPAGGFYTAIYLSTDATITSADRFVVSHYNSAGLAAGASITLSNTVDLPANLPADTYYVGAIADLAPASVPESDENNNALAGNQQYLNIDLVVTSVTGTVANGKLTYSTTVKNIGTAPAGGFYTAIYLSTDATITSADRFVVSQYNSAGLAAGASITLSNTVDLPANLPADTYYVGAIADLAPASVPESDENNNALAGNQQYLNIDLVVTSVTSSVANGKLTYSATVKNIGTAPAGGFYTAIYLSTDATITSADRFVVSHYNSAGLAAGASITLSNTVDLPANLPADTYYVGAIADLAPASVPESDENNNALAGNQQYLNIDLVVSSVTASVANGKITYSATVKNNGSAPAGGFYTSIYLSPDATITTADRFVVSHYNSAGLAAGASVTLSNTVSLPAGTAGTYYVGAIADMGPASVPESEENNNDLAGNQLTM